MLGQTRASETLVKMPPKKFVDKLKPIPWALLKWTSDKDFLLYFSSSLYLFEKVHCSLSMHDLNFFVDDPNISNTSYNDKLQCSPCNTSSELPWLIACSVPVFLCIVHYAYHTALLCYIKKEISTRAMALTLKSSKINLSILKAKHIFDF